MKHKYLLPLFLSILFLGACKKDLSNQVANGQTKSLVYTTDYSPENIPYATQSELEKFDRCADVIHYKVARYYAYAEIENSIWIPLKTKPGAYRLTELPVIVYDFDSKPKYYEFGVVAGGRLIGSIATIAKKEASEFVSCIFNYPLSYSDKGYNDYIVGAYPSNFLGKAGEPGSAPTLIASPDDRVELKAGVANTYLNYAGFMKEMDAESQVEYAEGLVNMAKELAEMNDGLVDFWQKTDEKQDHILRLSDEEILVEVQDSTFGKTESSTTWSDEFIIPAYNIDNMKKTWWNGACGPSAAAWVYRGLYATYPKNTAGNYLSIHGNPSHDNFWENVRPDRAYYGYNNGGDERDECTHTDFSLYKTLLSHCMAGSKHPMTPTGLSNGMKEVTDKEYKVSLTTDSYGRIKNQQLPVFNMIGFGGQLHWLIAFGMAYDRNKKGKIKKKYLFVTDNSTAISRNNYSPYWRGQSSDPGIRYKLTK